MESNLECGLVDCSLSSELGRHQTPIAPALHVCVVPDELGLDRAAGRGKNRASDQRFEFGCIQSRIVIKRHENKNVAPEERGFNLSLEGEANLDLLRRLAGSHLVFAIAIACSSSVTSMPSRLVSLRSRLCRVQDAGFRVWGSKCLHHPTAYSGIRVWGG